MKKRVFKEEGIPEENVENEHRSACEIANYKLAADHWQLLYSGFEGDGLGFVLGTGV